MVTLRRQPIKFDKWQDAFGRTESPVVICTLKFMLYSVMMSGVWVHLHYEDNEYTIVLMAIPAEADVFGDLLFELAEYIDESLLIIDDDPRWQADLCFTAWSECEEYSGILEFDADNIYRHMINVVEARLHLNHQHDARQKELIHQGMIDVESGVRKGGTLFDETEQQLRVEFPRYYPKS